jgi:hypothetical protein
MVRPRTQSEQKIIYYQVFNLIFILVISVIQTITKLQYIGVIGVNIMVILTNIYLGFIVFNRQVLDIYKIILLINSMFNIYFTVDGFINMFAFMEDKVLFFIVVCIKSLGVTSYLFPIIMFSLNTCLCNKNYENIRQDIKLNSNIKYDATTMANDDCSICYDSLSKGDIYKLECTHIYHNNCLGQWFNTENSKHSCPTCRRQYDNIV